MGRNKPDSPWRNTPSKARNRPKASLTLSAEELEALDFLAEDDAKKEGKKPNRSQTAGSIFVKAAAERKRSRP